MFGKNARSQNISVKQVFEKIREIKYENKT
jgi:hypothetical protein